MTSLSAPPTGPRVAVQIDRAELPEFQRAARILLAHPLVTVRWPGEGALSLVRRWEVPLRAEFGRVLGYRLDVGRTSARLTRKAAVPSSTRGARTSTGRLLGRVASSFLCLTVAALEGLGEQTTASALADEVLRLRSGDDELPVDLTQWDQRRAFVDAVRWLEERGVLRLCDGGVDRWLADDGGDALYDLDRDAASRLLVASPSVLQDIDSPAGFLVDPYPASEDGRRSRLRHRLSRRLVTTAIVDYDDLDPDELAHLRQRRGRIAADVELLTGCRVEARAEGLALIDAPSDRISAVEFPAGGTEAQAALLWGGLLVAAATPPSDDDGGRSGSCRFVADEDVDRCWQDVVEGWGQRFKAEFRDAPDRLRARVAGLLAGFGLVRSVDGGILVSAALARYRPAAAEDPGPAAIQRSLLDGFGDG